MEIIPAIDIIDGKCVRLTKGDYDQKKIYNEHPLEVAKSFEGHGIKRLHLVDLDGAKAAHIVNYKVLESIASQTGLHIDFGGGLKTDNDLRIAFESGAKQITGGSIAVKDPSTFESWLKKYSGEQIILGADVHGKNIAVQGWTETSDQELIPFVEDYMGKGVVYAICTDIEKDGAMQGPSTALYREIRSELPALKLIASGGVTTLQDLEDLDQAGCYGAIVGKAIYEGTIGLDEIEKVYFR